jgi:hypothetical protein
MWRDQSCLICNLDVTVVSDQSCLICNLDVTVLRDQSCLICDLDVERSELLDLGSRCNCAEKSELLNL